MAELLEVAAHGVTAILATWLGLLVLTRARSVRGARIFGFLCLLLVTWSTAVIIQRTGHDASVKPMVNAVEDLAAFLLPAATLHIAVSVTLEGRRPLRVNALLVTAYLLGVLTALQATLDPAHPIDFQAPFWEPLGVPGSFVAWLFTALRALIFAAAIGYLVSGLRAAGGDTTRRRQLLAAVLTVAVGAAGGIVTILPDSIGGPPFIGVSMVAVAAVLASYAILAQHLFVAADVADRALRWSVLAGLALVAYIALVIGLESVATSVFDIDLPLVTALAIVVTLALADPVVDRAVEFFGGGSRTADELRLLQALGSDSMVTQRPEDAVVPVLERIARTFGLAGAAVIDDREQVRARVGAVDVDQPQGLRLPLIADDQMYGYAMFAPSTDGRGFTPSRLRALRLAASFLASTLRLADRQSDQLSALAGLRAEREAVESHGSALEAALMRPAESDGLHLYALGVFRVEAHGEVIRRWGGEKAGSRQAEALFAFLFDRGERGVAKDEVIELVWPDVDLERADVAFHRTLLGLRRTLREVAGTTTQDSAISYRNDRYRLPPGLVGWSDVAEFERIARSAASAGEGEQLRLLEEARGLYRGDYLDDVPFYGDGQAVDERRQLLREAYGDVLLDLGAHYTSRGEARAAGACFREAASLGMTLPVVADSLGIALSDAGA